MPSSRRYQEQIADTSAGSASGRFLIRALAAIVALAVGGTVGFVVGDKRGKASFQEQRAKALDEVKLQSERADRATQDLATAATTVEMMKNELAVTAKKVLEEAEKRGELTRQHKQESDRLSALLATAEEKIRGPKIANAAAFEQLIEQYLKTPPPLRGRLTTDPESFEKVQGGYYAARGLLPTDGVACKVLNVSEGPKSGYTTVRASLERTGGGKVQQSTEEYFFVLTNSGLKLDWLSLVGYNDTSLKAVFAETPKPITMRFEAELHDKRDNFSEEVIVLKLHNPWSKQDVVARGFCEKKTKSGKRLMEILKDGLRHNLVLEIARSPFDNNDVTVKELVSETWVR
jgi:hypothetical protein